MSEIAHAWFSPVNCVWRSMRCLPTVSHPHHTEANLQRRFAVRSNFARGVTALLTKRAALRRLRMHSSLPRKLTDPRLRGASGGARTEQAGVCVLRTPLRTARQKLLQRGVDRGEFGIEFRAQSIHRRDDGKGNTGGNQAILDGRGRGFVFQKSGDNIHSWRPIPLFCPSKPFWIDNVRASLAAW